MGLRVLRFAGLGFTGLGFYSLRAVKSQLQFKQPSGGFQKIRGPFCNVGIHVTGSLFLEIPAWAMP